MKTIEIYWDDLTKEKQEEILELLGDNGNYDVFPIAIIEYADEEDMTSNAIVYWNSTNNRLCIHILFKYKCRGN